MQIVAVLKDAESHVPMADLPRKHESSRVRSSARAVSRAAFPCPTSAAAGTRGGEREVETDLVLAGWAVEREVEEVVMESTAQ